MENDTIYKMKRLKMREINSSLKPELEGNVVGGLKHTIDLGQ